MSAVPPDGDGVPAPLLTVDQVAGMLAVSPSTVRRMIRARQLRAVNVGTGTTPRWRVAPADVQGESGTTRSAPMSLSIQDKLTAKEDLRVTIAVTLWMAWAMIAIEREDAAKKARKAQHAAARMSANLSPHTQDEFHASLVCISAVAGSLEALYGQLTDGAVGTAEMRVGTRTTAAERIRDCLHLRFYIDEPTRKRWANDIGWLFGLRNNVLHAEFEHHPFVRHPSGLGPASPLLRDYSVGSNKRALALLLDVIDVCTSTASPNDEDARVWAETYRTSFHSLTQHRARVAAGMPLLADSAAARAAREAYAAERNQ